MVKYEKKIFGIDEAEEQETPLQKISRLIVQEQDNEIAKAFTLHISKLLIDNGIFPIVTKRPMDVSTITDTDTYKIVVSHGISFVELDTSEHDAKVRAEALKPIVKIIDDYVCGRVFSPLKALNQIKHNIYEQLKGEEFERNTY